MSYQTFDILRRHKTKLRESVTLDSGIQLASWFNCQDKVTNLSDHHTLSLYIADGYDTWHKTPHGWRNGGGPDRFCLMPANSESCWDVRARLSFVHLYCTEEHLLKLAGKIWDRSPQRISLDEQVFAEDPRITQLYRHFLLSCDWQQPANHLMLSTASTLLMTGLVQQYSTVNWQLPTVRGGLAPRVLKRVDELITTQLSSPLTLAELAAEAALSDYHFARMFRQSTGQSPHQYVMIKRMNKAEQLLRYSPLSLTAIAEECGFSSLSHFSHRFRAHFGQSPSVYRQTPP